MHEGRVHVTPETGTSGTFVPSNTYLDTASLTSSGVSTGLMGAGLVAYIAPGFLASMGLPSGMMEAAAVGLLGVGLGTINLVLGLRLRARCHDLSERGEKILFAHADTRKLMLDAGVPLRKTDGPAKFAASSVPEELPHDHDDHDHEEPEPPHEHEHPNPNAPAGA
jgi:hypothetical protein